ncbi:hypothetical protein CHS0354_023494 [Potamilus streckersoni]|uniref:Uncharacterized protein n=1 Tax=Potamilus streckersoni TaxID=2493646 RepID=A0AAE0S7R3_9BIVA|nr:hypothetical protein CHS0354_023494 [Potamilus streckersoni]
MEEAYERNRPSKAMIAIRTDNQWKAWILRVEVRCRGFAAHTIWLRALGVIESTDLSRRNLITKVGKLAETNPPSAPPSTAEEQASLSLPKSFTIRYTYREEKKKNQQHDKEANKNLPRVRKGKEDSPPNKS